MKVFNWLENGILHVHCAVQDSRQEVINEQCYSSCEIFLKGYSALMDVIIIIITFFEAVIAIY